MKTWPMWAAGTVALAAVFHILTIFGLPYGIMDRAMAGIANQAGGVNKASIPTAPPPPRAASCGRAPTFSTRPESTT